METLPNIKVLLSSDEKRELLSAVAFGVLNSSKIPRIVGLFADGRNTFLELLKSLPDLQENEAVSQ